MNKKDYLNQVFNAAKRKLHKQSIKAEEMEKFSKIFNTMLSAEDLFAQLYLVMQIKKLEELGKYLLYISKKIDDNIIDSSNIYGNIISDSEFIEKEIMRFMGVSHKLGSVTEAEDTDTIIEQKPKLKEKVYIVDNKDPDEEEDKTDEVIKEFYRAMEQKNDEEDGELEIELIKEDDDEEVIQSINLELLDIDRNPQPGEIDMVFELPSSVVDDIIHDSFIEHINEQEESEEETNIRQDADTISLTQNTTKTDQGDNIDEEIESSASDIIEASDNAVNVQEYNESESGSDTSEIEENNSNDLKAAKIEKESEPVASDNPVVQPEKSNSESDDTESDNNDENVLTELPKSIDEIFEEKVIEDNENDKQEAEILNKQEKEFIKSETQQVAEPDTEEAAPENLNIEKPAAELKTEKNISEEKVTEETDIQDEILEEIINEEPQQTLDFDIPIIREEKKEEESAFIEREQAPEEANQEFVEYEKSVMRVNTELFTDFEMMMQYAKKLNKDYAQRDIRIKEIISKTYLMENLSKELQFEVITNIYQTYRYSFEKISDGKYDISEDTLHLFIKGIELINSLLREDSISGYDKQLKDLDKIRKALLSENKKKNEQVQKKKEEEIIESSIHNKYPDHFQREIIFKIRKKILETEKIFNSINEINSEFILYDRLRLLGENLNNFKELVQNAKAINLDKLAKLSEGGYILIKYIQNYRIDPSSEEMREIFGYITYNLKLLVLDKPAEDIDVFISYLYDPVKIFTEQKKIDNDKQTNS